MGAIADLIEIGIETAGSDFMQQRLPDVAGVAIDEDDVEIAPAEMAGELADKLKAAGTTADNDNLGLAAIGPDAGHGRTSAADGWRLT
jgi:hypothetical protein